MTNRKLKTALLSTAALFAAVVAAPVIAADKGVAVDPNTLTTKYPIKHLVVIFNENISFDHYFGIYPNTVTLDGEPAFKAAAGTQTDINNYILHGSLLENNPNATNTTVNGAGAANPFRLDRTQAETADQGHGYTPEQSAYDHGKNDAFPAFTGKGTSGGAGAFGSTGQVMGYFDAATVTAFWNYAQNYAMSDNAWSDDFGPSTPGALNMFAGTTNGAKIPTGIPAGNVSAISDGQGGLTLINDTDPAGDVCSSATAQVQMTSKNIGDLLNAKDIPWGSFVGGFNLQTVAVNGTQGCGRSSFSQVTGSSTADYVAHHAWFQYYTSTANPTHARPTSTASIGYTIVPNKKTVDPANHAYDIADFTAALSAGNFPAVSFIKQPAYQDGHAGYSNPLDEQEGLVDLINFIQEQPDWNSTAIIIAYDDSDGWYDHASASPLHPSFSPSDTRDGTNTCGVVGATEPAGVNTTMPVHGRCGPGTRQPFLVISPYAKKNFVSHTLITQASIPQFIEDNWNLGRIGQGSFDATTGSIVDMFNFNKANSVTLMLDPKTGTIDTKAKQKNN